MNRERDRVQGAMNSFRTYLEPVTHRIVEARQIDPAIDTIRFVQKPNVGIKSEFYKNLPVHGDEWRSNAHIPTRAVSELELNWGDEMSLERRLIMMNCALIELTDYRNRQPQWETMKVLQEELKGFRLEKHSFLNSVHFPEVEVMLMMDNEWHLRYTVRFNNTQAGRENGLYEATLDVRKYR